MRGRVHSSTSGSLFRLIAACLVVGASMAACATSNPPPSQTPAPSPSATRPGDAAGWKAGTPNGHCLINRTARDALFLEIGSRAPAEKVDYSDIDMRMEREGAKGRYLHKSGAPYPGSEK